MKLKIRTIIFLIILIAYIFGNKSLTINIHDTYYVFNFFQLMICILFVILGSSVLIDIIKYKNKMK